MPRQSYTVRFSRSEYEWMQQHLTGQVSASGDYRADPWSAKEMSSAATKLKRKCPNFGFPGQVAFLDGQDMGTHLEIEFGHGADTYLIIGVREGGGAVTGSRRTNRSKR